MTYGGDGYVVNKTCTLRKKIVIIIITMVAMKCDRSLLPHFDEVGICISSTYFAGINF